MLETAILDDDPKAAKHFGDLLKKSAKAAGYSLSIQEGGVGEFLDALRRRQDAARSGKPGKVTVSLDSKKIVIVDYDLGDTRNAMGLTGEEFSYLARCYSTCGAIIALNQFPHAVFDLTLVSRGDTWADLNIDDDQLGSPGLWSWNAQGFRPWSWPRLGELPGQVSWLASRFEKALKTKQTMVKFLAMPMAAQEALLPGHLDHLGPLDAPLEEFARRQLVRKDQGIDDHKILARAGSSRLRTLLEHVLAPGQDLLCDIPHLAQRFPSLTGNSEDTSRWTQLVESAHKGPPKLFSMKFALSDGLSRAYYWLPEIRAQKVLLEDKEPWNYKAPRFNFLEDRSTFVPPAKSRKFSPGALGSMQVGYISTGIRNVTYLPVTRLLE